MEAVISVPKRSYSLFSLERVEMPKPKAFKQSTFKALKSPGCYSRLPPSWTVDVSIATPHLIQNISPELLAALKYKPAEVSNRSISMLQGPDTNFAAIRAAIKAVDMLVPTTLPLVVYSRDGAANHMIVECRPIMGADYKPCGCRIRMRTPSPPGSQELRNAPVLAEDLPLRRLFRSQDRLRTGLAIQMALNRRKLAQ